MLSTTIITDSRIKEKHAKLEALHCQRSENIIEI